MSDKAPPANEQPDANEPNELRAQLLELSKKHELTRQREAQLRQIIDLLPDYVFATDSEGRFLIVNETLASAYGRSVEQVVGQLEQDLTPDSAQSARLLADNAEVLHTGQPKFVPEQTVVDATGGVITAQIHRIPYVDAVTGQKAVLGVGTDISERKRIEQALLEKQRLEHDLSIARKIQRGLLPTRPPITPGFAVAGWNESADETGGDYFDWLTLPDGRTLFSMGDVSGHGLGSAMIVAVCRAYLRASTTALDTLEQAISRVNGLLEDDLPPNRFIALVVGLLDTSCSTVNLFSAGHGPVLFYKAAEQRVIQWQADDLPLGVARVDECVARQIAFEPNDTLLLVTDGFFEWEDPSGERYGLERLEHIICQSHDRPPDALIAALCADVQRFASGSRQQDDLTAVVVKKLG
jgi:PAS domain S-box-containing protein